MIIKGHFYLLAGKSSAGCRGYPDITAKTVKNGWLHTGDMGPWTRMAIYTWWTAKMT
ncbi:hypothetical protein DCCM_2807 [Desulfocucumis palustris]|uniref:Long-chain-fatty-acid--CoA ligase n=1 Tax=Desulfocucumis palustris TaxID=1898651 RepID=A0A2L2XIH0_9FIRM|nr:hypothetical protein DCCM_2807 [Desulfocucumis palustris]